MSDGTEKKGPQSAERWDIDWTPIGEIKFDPKNRNIHSEEQIERLAKLIVKYGWVGNPLVVSNTTGLCKAGEGRVKAALKAGLTHVPVHFKTFASEADEYGFGIADNASREGSKIDRKKVAEDILEFGPDFDVEDLGFEDDLVIDPAELPETKTVTFQAKATSQFLVVVDCKSESAQAKLFEELQARGLECKIL